MLGNGNCPFQFWGMAQEILTYLNGKERDYQSGVNLLDQVLKNKFLIRHLRQRENRGNILKLEYELKKYAGGSDGIKNPSIATKTAQKSILTESPPQSVIINPDDKEAAEKLEIGLTRMHNKRGILSNSLRNFKPGDKAGRKRVLDQIEDITGSMEQVRGKLDYFKDHGSLPPLPEMPPVKTIPDDPFQMQRKLLNLRTSRTKLKTNIANPGSQKKPLMELKNKLKETESLITEIQNRIHAANR